VRVVVTGGAGFIGANLCRRLVADPAIDSVVVLDDLSTGSTENLRGLDVDLVEASLLDPDAVDRAVRGATSVVHLGARPSVPRSVEDPMRSHLVNATGTMEVLEGMRRAGVGHLVVASSSSVYGANPALPKVESLATRPLSPYAASKLATEAYALSYASTFGFDVLAFRFFNVFGPLQAAGHAYAAVIPAFVDAALAGRPLPVHADGTQSRDFTYVGTVSEVIATAVVNRVSFADAVNLAFGERVSLLDVIDLLGELLGRELEIDFQDRRVGDVPHSQADAQRLHELFPTVEAVPLREGLQATIDWFRASA
jgi:UDP-glucose 4-epimerase